MSRNPNNYSNYAEMIYQVNKRNRKSYKKMLDNQTLKEYSINTTKNTSINNSYLFEIKTNCSSNLRTRTKNDMDSKNSSIIATSNRDCFQTHGNAYFLKHYKFSCCRLQNKMSVPFNIKEKRFYWQNPSSNHLITVEDYYNKLKRKNQQGALKGGFKAFYSRPEIVKKINRKKLCTSLDFKTVQNRNDSSQINIILTQNNNINYLEPYRPMRKQNERRNLQFHSTTGAIKSLLDKTPMNNLQIFGKKRYKSHDADRTFSFNDDFFFEKYAKKQNPEIKNIIYYDHFKHLSKSVEDIRNKYRDNFIVNAKKLYNFNKKKIYKSYITSYCNIAPEKKQVIDKDYSRILNNLCTQLGMPIFGRNKHKINRSLSTSLILSNNSILNTYQ